MKVELSSYPALEPELELVSVSFWVWLWCFHRDWQFLTAFVYVDRPLYLVVLVVWIFDEQGTEEWEKDLFVIEGLVYS